VVVPKGAVRGECDECGVVPERVSEVSAAVVVVSAGRMERVK
jgi:hypothetical protein